MQLVYNLTDDQLNIPIRDISKYATVGEPETDTIIFLDSSFLKTKFDENEEPINFIGWSINRSEYIYSRPITKDELLFNIFNDDTHSWTDDYILNIRPVFESEKCKTTNFNLEITDAEDENSYGVAFSHEGHIEAYEVQKVTVTIKIIPFRANDKPIPEISEKVINVDIFGGLYQYQNLDFTAKFTNIPKIIADNIDKATVAMLIMWTDKMDESHIDTLYITNDKPQIIVTGEGHIKTDGWVYADDIYVTHDFMQRITSSFPPGDDDTDFLQQIFTKPANHFLSNLIDEIIRKLKTPSIKELWRHNISVGSQNPYSPGENVTIMLKEQVSKQRVGIILVWSFFEKNGAGVQNYDWCYTFIPKWHVTNYEGEGIHCTISILDTLVDKYIYLFDKKLKGHKKNYNSNNTKLCLRAVLGV